MLSTPPAPRIIPTRQTPTDSAMPLSGRGSDDLQSAFSPQLKIFRYPQEFDYDSGRWVIFKAVDPLVGLQKVDEQGKKVDTTIGTVVTYLPADGLKTSYSVEYQEKSLGAGGGPIAQSLQASHVQDGSAGWKQLLDNAYGSALGFLTEWSVPGGSHVNAEDIVAASRRITLNRYQQQLFNGVKFRTHTFTLKMGARNPQEAEAIDNIIQLFKVNMLPTYDTTGSHDLFFGFPAEWEINFHPEIEATTFKILRSVLTDMDVDYAADQVVSFHKSVNNQRRPVAVDVTLKFTELILLTRNLDASLGVIHGQGNLVNAASPIDTTSGRRNLRTIDGGGRTYRF